MKHQRKGSPKKSKGRVKGPRKAATRSSEVDGALPAFLPSGLIGTIASVVLATAAGASMLGAWRLWAVPGRPLAVGFENELAMGPAQFVVIGAAMGLLASGLWHLLATRLFALSREDRNLALQWTALPLLLAWLPIGATTEYGRVWYVWGLVALAGAGGVLGARALGPRTATPARLGLIHAMLGVAIGLVTLSLTTATVLGFRGLYNCSYSDFGGFHNAAWNTLHGHFMYTDHWDSGGVGMIWRIHLTVFLLVPMLALLIDSQAEVFLLLQALGLALAALPIFLTARRETSRPGFALALALAYLLYPFVNRVAMYEFHVLSFASLTMAWLLWACRGGAPSWTLWLLGAGALLVREDMALPVMAVGLWEASAKGHRRRGLILMAMALAWAVLSINFFMPSAAVGHWTWKPGGGGHLDRYAHLGSSYGEIVKTLLTRPAMAAGLLFAKEKLPNFILLVLPLIFLPLLSPGRLVIAAPVFFLHALSNWRFQNQLDCQYTAPMIPAIFFAAIGGAARLARFLEPAADAKNAHASRPQWAWRAMTAGLIGAALTAHLFTARWRPGVPPPLSPYDGRQHLTIEALPWRASMFRFDDRARLFQDLRKAFPKRAALGVPDVCAPHLTARPLVRALRRMEGKPLDELDFVLYSPRIPAYMNREETLKLLGNLIGEARWEVVFNCAEIIVFARPGVIGQEFRAILAALENQYPDSPTAHRMIGQLAAHYGRRELALREARAVEKLQPGDAWATATLKSPEQNLSEPPP